MEASTRADRQANAGGDSSTRKALTIGAVAKILGREFDDISISKIRYLEDQKLLSPRRTPGGYRLYSQADVERLREILRMQRDEFLPLRVIRQELATGGERKDPRGSGSASVRRASSVDGSSGARLGLEELVDQTGVAPDLIRELEEWRIVQPEQIEGQRVYDETDREIVKACGELFRFGVAGRNLRVLRTSADREATAAGAGGGTGASLEQPQPPQGGDREPRGPGLDLQQPHPPAAGARPAQADRGVSTGQ